MSDDQNKETERDQLHLKTCPCHCLPQIQCGRIVPIGQVEAVLAQFSLHPLC